jgi:RNA polymerase-interacting CarD/CdnL/TRCF family regulator
MPFEAGDYIVHPVYGLGQVARLEERQLAEDEFRLYYVIVAEKSTVWVPVNGETAAPLRQVTPKHEMDRYRRLLKSSPSPLAKEHSKRRLAIAERLRQGSFQSLCEVVRDLTARAQQKSFYDAESTLLQKIRMDLCREWAAAEGLSLAEAIQEVEALLGHRPQALAAER